MYLIWTIILGLILLVIIGLFSHSLIQLKREWPLVKEAWIQMNIFEKNLLKIGVYIFIFIPLLKSHPSANWYFAQILIEILPVLAGSFFVVGVISFMKQAHKIKGNSHRRW
jgi:uncharacterized membrane protein YraQ (UPF0718 family)